MVARRECSVVLPDGRRCRAGPQLDRAFCFAHDPERATEAAEARRLGGLRRRREGTVSVAYDLPGLDRVEGIRRILLIATIDVLGLDNSIARARVLISAAQAATKLLETGELEERIEALELAIKNGHRGPASAGGLLAG